MEVMSFIYLSKLQIKKKHNYYLRILLIINQL